MATRITRVAAYLGHPICKRCGGFELPNSNCCKLSKLPADIRLIAETRMLLVIKARDAENVVGYKDLPRVKGSHVRAWNYDVVGCKDTPRHELKAHPNKLYEINEGKGLMLTTQITMWLAVTHFQNCSSCSP